MAEETKVVKSVGECAVDFAKLFDVEMIKLRERLKAAEIDAPKVGSDDINTYLRDEIVALKDFVEGVKKQMHLGNAIDDEFNRKLVNLHNQVAAMSRTARRFDEFTKGATKRRGFETAVQQFMGQAKRSREQANTKLLTQVYYNFQALYKRGQVDEDTVMTAYDAAIKQLGGSKDLIDLAAKELDIDATTPEGIESVRFELFKALKYGHYENSPTLNILGKVQKMSDKSLDDITAHYGVPFELREGHVIPYRTNKRYASNFEAEYRELLKSGTDWDDVLILKEGEQISDELIDKAIDRKVKNDKDPDTAQMIGARVDFRRNWKWTSDEFEYEYVSRFVDRDRDPFTLAMLHKQNIVRRSSLYQFGGPNITKTNEMIKSIISKKNQEVKDKTGRGAFVEEAEIDDMVDSYANKVGMSDTVLDPADQTIGEYVQAVSNVLSMMQVTRNVPRDIGFDRTILPATSMSLVFGHEAFSLAAKNIGDLTKNSAKYIISKGNRAEIDKLIATYENVGFSIDLSLRSVITDDLGKEVPEALSAANRHSRTAADAYYKWMGASAMAKVDRFTKLLQVGDMFHRQLQEGYATVSPALKKAMKEVDMDEADFADLAHIDAFVHKGGRVIDPEKIVSYNLRPEETQAMGNMRLRNSYMDLMHRLHDDNSTRTSLRGDLGNVVGNHGWAKLVKKYTNMPLSAIRTLTDNMRNAAGIGPDSGDMMVWWRVGAKNPKVLASAIAPILSGAVLLTWMEDLADGREPKDMTKLKNIGTALSSTGAGGLLNLMVRNFYYNNQAFSDPSGSIPQEAKRLLTIVDPDTTEESRAYNFRQLMRRMPFINYYYLNMIWDKTFSELSPIEVPGSVREKYKELGNQKLFLE